MDKLLNHKQWGPTLDIKVYPKTFIKENSHSILYDVILMLKISFEDL